MVLRPSRKRDGIALGGDGVSLGQRVIFYPARGESVGQNGPVWGRGKEVISMKKAMRKVSIRIEADLSDKLEEMGRREGVTLSEVCRRLLHSILEGVMRPAPLTSIASYAIIGDGD